MGSNTIVAIVVGAILVIVGFSLWPVLNGASNSLFSYFRDSCDDGNGNRFLQAYAGTTNTTGLLPIEYSTQLRQHGGAGQRIVAEGNECRVVFVDDITAGGQIVPVDDVLNIFVDATTDAGARYADLSNNPVKVYNEQGDVIGTITNDDVFVVDPTLDPPFGRTRIGLSSFLEVGDFDPNAIYRVRTDLAGDYNWVRVAPMLERFAGINNLLLTILPVVSIAGFLGISGAKLYSYGKGTASIGSSISTSIFTLIGIVIAMVIAGPIMGAAVDANQVVVSGQYQVNGTFGNIIQLLFAMIPVVYIAGLVTLVGLQARTALLGGSGGGGGSNSMT